MLAAMCILSVRAVIVQLAFFLHMQVLFNSFLCFLETSSSRRTCINLYTRNNDKSLSQVFRTGFLKFMGKLFEISICMH